MGEQRGKGRIDVVISVLTLATSLIGFASAGFVLVGQKNELDRQAQAISETQEVLSKYQYAS